MLAEYESSLSQLAKLPDETLCSYGYTSEQIALLKVCDAGTLSFTEIAAAALVYAGIRMELSSNLFSYEFGVNISGDVVKEYA